MSHITSRHSGDRQRTLPRIYQIVDAIRAEADRSLRQHVDHCKSCREVYTSLLSGDEVIHCKQAFQTDQELIALWGTKLRTKLAGEAKCEIQTEVMAWARRKKADLDRETKWGVDSLSWQEQQDWDQILLLRQDAEDALQSTPTVEDLIRILVPQSLMNCLRRVELLVGFNHQRMRQIIPHLNQLIESHATVSEQLEQEVSEYLQAQFQREIVIQGLAEECV